MVQTCTFLPILGVFQNPPAAPYPIPLPFATGDPGLSPAESDGEGAALLQLRRLWHPLCGPGGWSETRGMQWPGGMRGLCPGQVLVQLLMLFFWLQDTWTPEEVIPKRLREKQK